MVICEFPVLLFDVISVIPAIRPKLRSRGVVTAEAIVSGLAPGRFALTLSVGYSTWGSGATGRKKKANTPAMASSSVNNDVATGRLMNGVERLIVFIPRALHPRFDCRHGNHADGMQFDRR